MSKTAHRQSTTCRRSFAGALAGILVLMLPQVGFCSADEARCWRGQPSPGCSHFWITQFGVGARLNNPSYSTRATSVYSEYVVYDVGPMFNYSSSTALGGTVSVKLMKETHLGLFGCYRRWFDDTWALDIFPGVLLLGGSHDDDYKLIYPTAAARVALNYEDWVGVSTGLEIARIENNDTEVDWFADVHLGYYPGAAVGLLFLVLAVAVSSSIAVPP